MANRDSIGVLIVDDSEPFRRALSSLLGRAADIEVVGEARDGSEAIRLAVELGSDVITMDLEMPVMDGVEATRAILGTIVAAPIVVVTASDYRDGINETLAAGAVASVSKARVVTDLIPTIRQLAGAGSGS